MERKDLIDSPASVYLCTALWASAIHESNPDVAGLAWTSRRSDPDIAYVFFEDRVPLGSLNPIDTRTQADGSLLNDIIELGLRADIVRTL